MLTDYHTHLRPDDLETDRRAVTSPSATSRATWRPRRRAGIAELGFSEHVYRFRQALDVWRHPFWEEHAVDDLDAYVEFVLDDDARRACP